VLVAGAIGLGTKHSASAATAPASAGGLSARPQALLVGGYFGTWIAAAGNLDTPLSVSGLRPLGASLGARTIVVLPADACGVAESARVARYLAGESASQCGPCVFGLPAVADALEAISSGRADAKAALERLPRLRAQIARRGVCAHPDGVLRFVDSTLAIFADEISRHLAGRCAATSHDPVLPTTSHSNWR
jgi:NADH:ubiquinone oxidoreductase subunit F (NADH-binding)